MTERSEMPPERNSITHKFRVGAAKGYLTVGLYPDGRPGEIFVNLSKAGTAERGFCSCLAILISVALQSGVPIEKIVEKLSGVCFEPSGLTANPKIPMAHSIADYIALWLEQKFLKKEVS